MISEKEAISMRLMVENIAKIKKADIECNGITIIAGENNTGKSTIGKILFSVFNSLCNIDKKIIKEKEDALFNLCQRAFYIFSPSENLNYTLLSEYINEFLKNPQMYIENSKEISNKLKEIYGENFDEPELLNLARNIVEILQITNETMYNRIILRYFISEFNGQINNIYDDNNSEGNIKLIIKDKTTAIKIKNNSIAEYSNLHILQSEAIYIDDPFVVDEVKIQNKSLYRITNNPSHRHHLITKLFPENAKATIPDEIITNNKLDKIYEKINSVCDGTVVSDSSILQYQKRNSSTKLNITSVSTGLKTFVIIKQLLMNGYLKHNGTVILDEPEIHLHPEWQLLFAELIVLIQKEFNMHILLNTHSPYFMKAIEVYASKYEIADKCKYYLTSMEDEASIIKDVTENPEEIYKLLARPLQDLENERYEND